MGIFNKKTIEYAYKISLTDKKTIENIKSLSIKDIGITFIKDNYTIFIPIHLISEIKKIEIINIVNKEIKQNFDLELQKHNIDSFWKK